MTDLVQLVQEADVAIIELEQSRAAVEAAKFALESAKEDFEKARSAFDQVIARSDEINVPRAKLRKLIEERSAALMASGLMSTLGSQPKLPKQSKAPKKSKRAENSEDSADYDTLISNNEAASEMHLNA